MVKQFNAQIEQPSGIKLNKHELARRYGVSVRSITNWMSNGLIPYLKISERMIRFDPFECDSALARNHRIAARGEAVQS